MRNPPLKKKKGMMTLNKKKARWGYLFVLPLLFGLIFQFGIPAVRSLWFAFCEVTVKGTEGFTATFDGLQNFYDALLVNTTFREKAVKSLLAVLLNLPLITIFSFFAASLLNQKFKGRWLVRTIFFLPLVLAAPALMNFDAGDALQNMMGSSGNFKASESLTGLESVNLAKLLISSGVLPQTIANYLASAADRIYDIIILSGVQILVFLAALQSIPPTMYEVASIEGASPWESYWRITFPMTCPMIMTCMIYTIIDSFTASTNATLEMIENTAFTTFNYGLSSAMSWIYTVLILLLLGLVVLIMRKVVKQYE